MPRHQVILKRHSAEGFLRKRWLVVGLGNPGPQYARTRHNLGFRVTERLQSRLAQPAFRASPALHARVSRGENLLAIPTTFMNDSGRAVRAIIQKYRIPLDHLCVVHDDKDLKFGTIKLQKNRGSAGHHGVQSVIDTLGSREFWRLRVGVGSPPPGTPTDAYVLNAFAENEEATITAEIIPRAVQTLRQRITP